MSLLQGQLSQLATANQEAEQAHALQLSTMKARVAATEAELAAEKLARDEVRRALLQFSFDSPMGNTALNVNAGA